MEKFRLQSYEARNIAEKILVGLREGKTINEISHQMAEISTSTVYKIANKLEKAGFIERAPN